MTSIGVERAGARVRVRVAGRAVIPRLIESTADSARVALVAGGAMLLGGDRVAISIDVGAGCALHLQDIGGTVAYDADGVASSWTVHARLAPGAILSWHALPFVVATGANVRRSLSVTLGEGAALCLRETLVLGRHSEVGGKLDSRTVIGDHFVEHVTLDGARREPGVLGSHRVLDTVVLAGRRPPATGSALELERDGALARFLGSDAHTSPLDSVFADWTNLLEDAHAPVAR